MSISIGRVRGPDDTEQALADFAGAVARDDAASAMPLDESLMRTIVVRLRANLQADDESLPLEEFLAGMPSTSRIRPALARYLREHPDPDLHRCLTALGATPLPPGSRPLNTNAVRIPVAGRFRGRRAFVYGAGRRAVVYILRRTGTIMVEAAIVNGVVKP
jgi:hypothetical protein